MATDSWSSNSNAAVSLRLIGEAGPSTPIFHPDFTYPIFGEAETIYGYQGLSIKLRFTAASLVPFLQVEYKAKNEATTAKIDDVEGTLAEFLPPDYLTSEEEFAAQAKAAFTPLGEKVHTYSRKRTDKGKGKAGQLDNSDDAGADARVFEIYRATWDTPGFRDLHRRMQIFALFFIEGASYIHEDESNWEFHCLYERIGDSYVFVGYTSLYRFWCWPDASRIRLSQFVILPPYHKQGHGRTLYTTVYKQMLSRDKVTELTVEDPSEAFDRLRDSADLALLIPELEPARLSPPIDPTWSESERLKRKIAPRQWSRLIEMAQLIRLDPSDEERTRAYRLQVKARLFRFNKDILTQLAKEERVQKLQETFESVLDEYADIVGVDVDPFLDALPVANGSSNGPPRKMARIE